MALATNLVAYWKLDGNSNDSVGTNNGVDTSISYSTTNAVINQAAQFGATSGILIPSTTSFTSVTTAVTMTGWFYATGASLTGPLTIVGKSTAAALNGQYMRIDVGSSKLNATVDGDFHTINGSTTLSLNTRYFVAVTYDGTTLSVYLNGAKDATDMTYSAATTPSTGQVGIGILGDFTGHQYFAGGAIDEVGWWTRGLSSAEISQLYNGGAGFQYPFTTSTPSKLGLLGVG